METPDGREGGGGRGGGGPGVDFSSPPDYPCMEECGRCSKEKREEPSSTLPAACSCECHCAKGLRDPSLQPPRGTNCMPGCGYSGLPCYNCSLLQAHLQPQHPSAGPPLPAFCPRIYTIELMERPRASGDADRAPRQQAGAEGEGHGKKVGVSLVFFTVFLIVFITIFKILFAGVRGSLW